MWPYSVLAVENRQALIVYDIIAAAAAAAAAASSAQMAQFIRSCHNLCIV